MRLERKQKENDCQSAQRRCEIANAVSDHVARARAGWKWSGRLIKKQPITGLKTCSAPKSALPPL